MKNLLHNLLGVFNGWICWVVFWVAIGVCAFVWLSSLVARGVTVSFDLRAERAFDCSVYYMEREEGPFQHVDTHVPAGNSQVRLLIPSAQVTVLRIDYGAAPGHVESSPVRIAGDKERILGWKDFSTFNDIAKRAIQADGWLSLDSEGNDPYAVFGKKLDMRAGMHFNWRSIVVRMLLLIGAAVWFFWKSRLVVAIRSCVSRNALQPASAWLDAAWHNSREDLRALLPDRSFAIYMLAIVLLAWGFELFNFTFTSDDDVVLCGGFSLDAWLKEGRWGMFILDKLYGNNSVPLFPLAITLFLYSLTFVMIFGHEGRSRYFLFPVYVAFPVLYQSFSFSSLNPGIGIAFFLAALAVRLSEGGVAACCVSVLLGAVSIGCYQIFVFLMAIVVVVRCMDKVWHEEEFRWRRLAAVVFRGCCMVVFSYVAYKVIFYGFQWVTGVSESYVTQRYLDLPKNWADWCAWWPLASKRIVALLSGAAEAFPATMAAYPVLLVAGAGTIAVWATYARRPPAVRFVLPICCMSLLVLAFLPLAFNRKAIIHDRIIILLIPAALVGFLSLSARCLARLRYCLLLWGGLCMLCAFQFIWGINQMAYSNYLRNRYDASFMEMVRSRVEALPEVALRRFRGEGVPLLIVGRSECDRRRSAVVFAPKPGAWPEWERDNVGRSLLVEPSRWRFAMKACLGTSYAPADSSKIATATMRFIESMPVWPLVGSVAWKDGYAIVKFSDFAPQPASLSSRLPRKLCLCRDVRINGFDELAFTAVDADNLLHKYGAGGVLASGRGKISLKLQPCRTTEPYLVLEFRTESEQNATLTLWGGNVRQECQFVLSKGADVLRLRAPSEFLSMPLRLDLSSSAGAAVKVLGVNVYADRKYTERLFALNPGLKDSSLLPNGGKR